MPPKINAFTRSYIGTALWSSNDESDESGGEPLDKNYSIHDLAPETLERVLLDTEQFQRENAEALEVIDDEGAGHDFWLTRNGHGAGFWDGDWPEPQATILTKASKRMGHVDLYVGDDGMLYMTPDRESAVGHARRLDKDAFEGVTTGIGTKDPAVMMASEINKELDRNDKAQSKIVDELIAAGRGNERAQETLAKSDPLALRYKALWSRRMDLRYEVERRYGPRAPSRLPRGFGPIKRI